MNDTLILYVKSKTFWIYIFSSLICILFEYALQESPSLCLYFLAGANFMIALLGPIMDEMHEQYMELLDIHYKKEEDNG